MLYTVHLRITVDMNCMFVGGVCKTRSLALLLAGGVFTIAIKCDLELYGIHFHWFTLPNMGELTVVLICEAVSLGRWFIALGKPLAKVTVLNVLDLVSVHVFVCSACPSVQKWQCHCQIIHVAVSISDGWGKTAPLPNSHPARTSMLLDPPITDTPVMVWTKFPYRNVVIVSLNHILYGFVLCSECNK